jgi:hypothetical protein
MSGKDAAVLPLPGGERIAVKGVPISDYSRLPNPLTLPSPRQGEGEVGLP